FGIYAQPALAAILVGGGIARMSRFTLVAALLIFQSFVGCGGKVDVATTPNPNPNPTPGTLQMGPSSLPAATVGSAYFASVTASGGSSPYTFSISAGALPTGLSLNGSTGAISGTPTVAGTASFTVHASDSSSTAATGNQQFSIVVSASPTQPAALQLATDIPAAT